MQVFSPERFPVIIFHANHLYTNSLKIILIRRLTFFVLQEHIEGKGIFFAQVRFLDCQGVFFICIICTVMSASFAIYFYSFFGVTRNRSLNYVINEKTSHFIEVSILIFESTNHFLSASIKSSFEMPACFRHVF